MRFIMTATHQQNKIARRRDAAKNKREHRAWHMAQATALREQADAMERALKDHEETHGSLFPEEREQLVSQIIDVRAAALEAENAHCLEDH
ncbi:hypothetical protein SEA_ZHENGYI_19 [Microbacterium phage Zhengyi]|nr:hypothetical protein SEA_ZHENGYI_19 [Microbacterium phage Zhengyi]QYC53789.1 hypothetical protein SEA_EUGENEKRABS_19 [Microbacterium phage EugeneKrabs]